MKTEPARARDGDNEFLAVDVDVADDTWHRVLDDPERRCGQILGMVHRFLKLPARPYEVSVLLTDDARQQALNAAYRGKDTSTNVLSFPSGEAAADGFPCDLAMPLGDITLALETVQREVAEADLSFADHFCHLLVHGMLHLAGYDHETDSDAEEMEALEIEILAALGIGNPYQPANNVIKV